MPSSSLPYASFCSKSQSHGWTYRGALSTENDGESTSHFISFKKDTVELTKAPKFYVCTHSESAQLPSVIETENSRVAVKYNSHTIGDQQLRNCASGWDIATEDAAQA